MRCYLQGFVNQLKSEDSQGGIAGVHYQWQVLGGRSIHHGLTLGQSRRFIGSDAESWAFGIGNASRTGFRATDMHEMSASKRTCRLVQQ
jgi:hypothetical protein